MKQNRIRFLTPNDISEIFVYCPYLPGILVSTLDKRATAGRKKNDKRTGAERRKNERKTRERRFLKIPPCPEYEGSHCPHKKYPVLRKNPELLYSLCHSKSILDFLRTNK